MSTHAKSRVAELADEEAARVEAEAPEPEPAEPEPDEPEPDEPEPEPQAAGPTPKQLRAFERQVTQHHDALKRIVGPDFELWTACDHCGGAGASPIPPPPVRELSPDPRTLRCTECGGWGYFQTESLVPEQQEARCNACGGTGIQQRLETPAYQPQQQAPPPPPPAPVYDPQTNTWVTPQVQPGNGYGAPQVAAPPPFVAPTT